ncbi:BREX-1 system adenine-specific DNA-methyltransferase PglX [Salinibacter ruber]|uniref:BREX-1 system adenine-specific DNA-methyltransferase PglX n=1 Tax=Salinibacter ruber TaxID=146919 RepID=UPI00216AA4EA|nr:BREX-1 system adenine-specific DNA-methyltransferase PglX [Salinibacter ruber]MCS4050717.1 hypothetical protein [Salinibacter ruber]
MQSLDTDLRSQLESTVEEAREVAETGARAALNQLGVGDREKPGYLSEEQAELRRRLRARGRQLGDKLKNSGEQETIRLAREIAYEHWHRMLFARFLAENDLLVHPELDVAVTLEDCEELADEEDARDGFELAARFATGMLPQIFREDDPVLGLDMAPEHRNKLKRMAEDLPEAVFEADDSLGWVYQFWQSKRKDEVNDSGDKIGADELPAVTQLFTEHYMVQFLLDNTLGAWWTARHPDADIDLDFEYLRFVEDEETGEQVPAAGTFDGWPDTAAELTVMDPCMGSGHFLVAALPMLARMRMHEEGLSAEAAVDRVITENLHGLEIDERCTQIAAFALAMAAWTFDGNSGYRELPEMNLACSGLAPEGDLEDWETLAGDDERLQNGMRRLYEIFQDAPTLGSLIDPSAPENRLDIATFEELEPLLEEVLAEEKRVETTEKGVTAHGIAQAASLLSNRYHLITTNVPYLKHGNQAEEMKEWLSEHYPRAKADLATAFVERCLHLSKSGKSDDGIISTVAPQNWLFLTSYRKFRKRLLKQRSWHLAAQLGPNSFETISGEVVNVGLYTIGRKKPHTGRRFHGIDANEGGNHSTKRKILRQGEIVSTGQKDQVKNPDSYVTLELVKGKKLMSEYGHAYKGITTGDDPKYRRYHWEKKYIDENWRFQQSTVRETKHFGGVERILWFEEMANPPQPGVYVRGEDTWGEPGIAVSQMNHLPCALSLGVPFDTNVSIVLPYDESNVEAFWAYAKSGQLAEEVRKFNKKLSVDVGYIEKVPFDLEYWQEVAEEEYPDGLPDPYSDDPTQWIFHGHPKPSERPLQVAVARLLGYRWPAERDDDMDLSDEAREWIERCKELDPHVDDDDIVCIPPVQGERAAADRIRDLLADAYGDEWGEGVLQDLLDEWGYRSGGLEAWLDGATARQKGKFAQQHNKLFGHRPFIWHVSDEHEHGFSALVNYHQLDRANLERLTYTYLGDWIKQQEAAMERGDEGAEGRLLAAQDLQEELEKIIEGEPPYDIFVRWKEAHEQPIGWDPDLNDGLLLNIKPFIEAGILRDEPNVRYTKDRGKNPEGAPWGPKRYNRYEDVPDEHKLKDEDGEVIEHLTNDVKRRVREEERG